MIAYTNSIEFAGAVLMGATRWMETSSDSLDPGLAEIALHVFGSSLTYHCEAKSDREFRHFFIVEHAERSQYDLMVQLCKDSTELPHGILCMAGSGSRFHGQRNREWDSPPGNVYLTAFFAPRSKIDHFGPGFIILPAVSVVETIDSVTGLSGCASTKWVNDILINGAKVAGVLTYTQAMGSEITGVVLGIGLNVETKPTVGANRFAPEVASLKDLTKDSRVCSLPIVLRSLISNLSRNYRLLLGGRYHDLLRTYVERSAIIGKDVEILTDDPDSDEEIIASGMVREIGENLDLYLEGRAEPITRGRLILRG